MSETKTNLRGTKRRTVGQIKEFLTPQQIFSLITTKEIAYRESEKINEKLHCRDRAFLSFLYLSAARCVEATGGHQLKAIPSQTEVDNKSVRIRDPTTGLRTGEVRIVQVPKMIKVRTGERYHGLRMQDLEIYNDYILIKQLAISKRSPHLIAKLGAHVAMRSEFPLPLVRGFDKSNPNWDALVPFSWMFLEYVKCYCKASQDASVFQIEAHQGWRICKDLTSQHPHWFRAMSEYYYANAILKNADKAQLFLGLTKKDIISHYIAYDWKAETGRMQDFSWVDSEVAKIQQRISKASVSIIE